jgi:hypothetical protein
MIGDIDEEVFKKKVQQREKANNRKADIRQVIDMYMTILIDIIQSFVGSRDVSIMLANLIGLREHYNDTLAKIQFCYKCSVPVIDPQFIFSH